MTIIVRAWKGWFILGATIPAGGAGVKEIDKTLTPAPLPVGEGKSSLPLSEEGTIKNIALGMRAFVSKAGDSN